MRARWIVPASALLASVACSEPRGASEPPQPSSEPTTQPSSHAAEHAAGQASAAPSSASGDPTAPPPQAAPSGPFVTTTRNLSWVFEKPRIDAPHAGWLRAGTRVRRGEAPVEGAGCKGKWWKIEPDGYVCEGHEGVTTDLDDPVVVATSKLLPDRTAPLPYGYATSNGTTPLSARVPTKAQQEKVEPNLEAHLARVAALRAKTEPDKLPPVSALPISPIPSFLEGNAAAPNVLGGTIPKGAVTIGSAWNKMRLSLLSAFESEGRLFYLTTEHRVVPADRMRAARLADFRGVELAKEGEPGEHLPMLWVRWKPARVYRLDGGKVVETEHTLPFQAHASIAGKNRTIGGVVYHELLSASFGSGSEGGSGTGTATYLVKTSEVTRVDAATQLPYLVGPDDPWIEVAIQRQSLVLYRGLRPVFVTLVSTGVDGVEEWQTTRATPRGHFRIHSKHLTRRMAGEEHPPWKEGEQPDPRYQIDDVPYVQYFQGGYALHAAFWHDAFGQPKSHGCINLSPRDALWLFGQTEPKLPDGWHGVYSGRAGAASGTTLVVKAY